MHMIFFQWIHRWRQRIFFDANGGVSSKNDDTVIWKRRFEDFRSEREDLENLEKKIWKMKRSSEWKQDNYIKENSTVSPKKKL